MLRLLDRSQAACIYVDNPSHNWDILTGNGLLGSSLFKVKYVIHGTLEW